MNKEILFEIGGEGGSISISRKTDGNIVKYIYHHNEFDPIDDETLINVETEFDSFEEPFQIINLQYSWYNLYIQVVHEDYRDYIIQNLIGKLNKKNIRMDDLYWSISRLEETLKIKLTYNINERFWSFQENHIDEL